MSLVGQNRKSVTAARMSGVGGRPDLNGAKADIGAGSSEAGDLAGPRSDRPRREGVQKPFPESAGQTQGNPGLTVHRI